MNFTLQAGLGFPLLGPIQRLQPAILSSRNWAWVGGCEESNRKQQQTLRCELSRNRGAEKLGLDLNEQWKEWLVTDWERKGKLGIPSCLDWDDS